MLLIIALANVAGVVFAGEPGADRGFNLVMFTLFHARGYPVFAVMFGYGLVQLARRQHAAGATPQAIRSVLLRRNGWLVAFGLAHAALLYYGDFLGAYGLVGIAMTLVLLRRSDRFHRTVLWLWGLVTVELLVLGTLAVLTAEPGTAPPAVGHIDSLTAPTYLDSLLDRLREWPVHTLTVLPFIVITWLGMWAARRRVLEDPASHVRLLRWTAVIGLSIAIAGGLPMALASAGWLRVDETTAALMSYLHGASGMFAGPGYVALFGLLVLRMSRNGPVVGALSALGRRSLSGYLYQSVAWLLLLAPFTLALAERFATPSYAGAVIAIGVWLVSVLAAAWLDRRNRPGPAEFLLRRLTYGPRRTS